MAVRLTWPLYTRLDLNGNPISGAQLFFYESETTKKLDTFSDEDLTVANANPVVANGSGVFGDIWLKQQNYKLILTSATDSDPPSGGDTFDPVQGNPAVSGDDFKASPQSSADMTVLVSAGALYDVVSKTIVVNIPQTSALIVAPSSDPRHDIIHVDRLTGVIGIDTGAEAGIPVDPAISDDKLPLARITLATTTTTITDAEITDIRELNLLGSGDLVRFNRSNIQGQTFTAFDDSGAADAYVITPVPAITAYAKYQTWVVDIGTENTGASTININALGVRNIFDFRTGAALAGGEILAGLNTFIDDGTQIILMTPASRVGVSANGILAPHKNLVVTNNSGTPLSQVDIDADEVVVTSSGGARKLLSSVNLTVDITASGANGLDTGAEAGSTWYHIWTIWNGTVAASLLSLSATSPTMPGGYTHKGYVSAVFNNGSSNFINFNQRDKLVVADPITEVSSGTATALTSISLQVPVTARAVMGSVALKTTAALQRSVTIQPEGAGTVGELIFQSFSSGTETFRYYWRQIFITNQTLFYKVNSGTAFSVDIVNSGWEY